MVKSNPGAVRLRFPGLAALALAGAALATVSDPAFAIVYQNSTAESAGLGAGQAFLDGEAALVVSLPGGAAGCSGSLVGGGAYVLTAAHCLTDASGSPVAFGVDLYFKNVGLHVSSSDYAVDPMWDGTIADGGDLALIRLATPVTSIASYALDMTSSAVGDIVTLAGYGYTGVGATGAVAGTFGTLRYGRNTIDAADPFAPSAYLFDFDKTGDAADNIIGDAGVGTDEAMVAPGDSGGASLSEVGGVWEIVGVHEFNACLTLGCVPNSEFGELGGDTSIYANLAWIDSVLPPAPEPATDALLAAGLLGILIRRRRAARE